MSDNSDSLIHVSSSPTVRQQLRDALSLEELRQLVVEGYVIQKQALTPSDLEGIREMLRQEYDVAAAARARKEEDELRLHHQLGPNCPKKQRRLFEALSSENGGALREEEVIEIVYQVEWDSLSTRKQEDYRNRLRKLEEGLNNRLIPRTTLRVRRIGHRILFLEDRTNPNAVSAMRERFRPLTKKESAELDRLWRDPQRLSAELLKGMARLKGNFGGEDSPEAQPPTLEETMALIREYLADGPKPSEDLGRLLIARGCLGNRVRRARKQLCKSYREGFSSDGRWLVRLTDTEPHRTG
jgi:hypothetical protein